MIKGILKFIWHKYQYAILPIWWWWSFYKVLTTDDDVLKGFLLAMLILLALPMIASGILLFWEPHKSRKDKS